MDDKTAELCRQAGEVLKKPKNDKHCGWCDKQYSNWRIHKRLCIKRPRK